MREINVEDASKRRERAILVAVAGDAGQSLRHRLAGLVHHALQVACLLLQQHVGMIEFLRTIKVRFWRESSRFMIHSRYESYILHVPDTCRVWNIYATYNGDDENMIAPADGL